MIAPEDRISKVRNQYGRTIEDILAKESEFDLYEVLGAIEVLVGSKISKKLATTASERMIFAFTWLGREVQNGGFHQYFFNSAGDFWKDVLYGLRAIGDEQGLALFQQTLSIFQESSPSDDRFIRQDQLEKLEEEDEERVWDHFRRMTEQYFGNAFPKWEAVFDYVKRHKDEFDLRDA